MDRKYLLYSPVAVVIFLAPLAPSSGSIVDLHLLGLHLELHVLGSRWAHRLHIELLELLWCLQLLRLDWQRNLLELLWRNVHLLIGIELLLLSGEPEFLRWHWSGADQ